MKKNFFAFLIMLIFAGRIFSTGQTTVKTGLNSVKVFLRGAELNQSASVMLDKGITEVVLTGLARGIDQNSINISASGDAVILSVVQKLDYLKNAEKSQAVRTLEDSLEILSDLSSSLLNQKIVLNAEYEMIIANRTIGGQNTKVTAADLQNMSAYFRKKLSDLRNEMLTLEKKIKNNDKKIERVKRQLDELNAANNQPVSEAAVTVSAKSRGEVDFTVSYNILDAGWNPVYDIRVDKPGSPIDLQYKANVRQNSGIDWTDAEIILSTRNPVQNNFRPELDTWFIDFMRKPAAYGNARMDVLQKSLSVAAAPEAVQAENMADYFEAEQKVLSVEFKPSIKYDIPSDGKPHLISLQENTIDAKYEYYAVPKLDSDAFLMAAITGWNNLNLLPGEAGIYFENSFTGKTFIDPANVKDTLMITLGRDRALTVSKEVLKDFTEDKFLSSDIERTFAFDIKIKNNKTVPVQIIVEDQIPVSKNENITVKLIDKTDAVYEADSGKLTWKVNVQPSESVTKKVVFSVRYPKDQTIPNL